MMTKPATTFRTFCLATALLLGWSTPSAAGQLEYTQSFDSLKPGSDGAPAVQALAEGWPGAPMTWAFSWRALHDERERYATLRRLAPEFHDRLCRSPSRLPSPLARLWRWS